MSHTRFELGFSRHKKIRRLSDAAFRLWVCAMDIAREQCSDGALDADDLDLIPKLPPNAKRRLELVAELVENGLWDVRGNGWQIHDFLDWQDSREVIENKRAAARERMRTVRANRTRTDKPTAPEVTPTSGSGEKKEERRSQPNGGRSGDVPCPVPVPLSDQDFAGFAVDVQLPRPVAEAWLLGWARRQDPGDLRSQAVWRKCAMAAVLMQWSDGNKRAAMRAAATPVAEPSPPKLDRTPTFDEVCT